MIRILSSIAATALALAPACFAQDAGGEPVPVWRRDQTHLVGDLQRLQGCLASAEKRRADESMCFASVLNACLSDIGDDGAASTAAQRGCAWREIAAWERLLDTALAEARADLKDEALRDFEAAQADWNVYMLADVKAHGAPYEGGSLQGVVEARARARRVAERAVELRAFPEE
jgi:uncharacterized protein YecT (DUF1311 family)